MWFVLTKNNNNKSKSSQGPCDIHHRIPTRTFARWNSLCFFRLTEEFNFAVFVKYVIRGVLEGKHRSICIFRCSFLWIHLNFLLCLGPWKMNLGSPWVSERCYQLPLSLFSLHTINSLCQIGFSTFPASFLGYTSSLGSLSWKKWKLTDYSW